MYYNHLEVKHMSLIFMQCRCAHLSAWDGESELLVDFPVCLWLCCDYIALFYGCLCRCFISVNLFVCPSHVFVVGHCWIGMVTRHKEKKTPTTSFISHVCALRQRFSWCLTLLSPPSQHLTLTHAPPHPPMIPSETAACALPLKRLKTQTVWVPPAARLKIPKPGCTLSLPVVIATSSLITTACFHSD